eukprot:SM000008S22365  [mRNA]  locus=s8:1249062:1250955:- [translate_table: standard]
MASTSALHAAGGAAAGTPSLLARRCATRPALQLSALSAHLRLPRALRARRPPSLAGQPRTAGLTCRADGQGDGGRGNRTPLSVSKAAKVRSEVTAPFRSVRMFFYLAFIASGTLGGLIALSRVVGALAGAPNADPLTETLKGLAIDVAAVVAFGLLYRSDAKAGRASTARFSREENLANLRLEFPGKKVLTVGQLRGSRRVILIGGSSEHVQQSLAVAEPLKEALIERGVLVVPLPTDGSNTAASEEVAKEGDPSTLRRWIAYPIYTGDWFKWLEEQMRFANLKDGTPVYISLRLDGRVRGSGVGPPPWSRLVAQLPPMKGIWAGALDGMDGRV